MTRIYFCSLTLSELDWFGNEENQRILQVEAQKADRNLDCYIGYIYIVFWRLSNRLGILTGEGYELQ